VPFGHIGGDDGSGLAEAVALEHRDTDGVEEALQLDIEEGAAADEEFEPSAEILAHFFKEDLVVEQQQRFVDGAPAPAAVQAEAVVGIGRLEGLVEERFHLCALLADPLLNVLAEVLRQGGDAEQKDRPGLLDGDRDILQGFNGGFADRDGGHAGAVFHQGIDAGGMGEAVVPGQDEQRKIPFRDRQQ